MLFGAVYQVFAAFLIDLWVGDPQSLPHPVVLIGKAITRIELFLRKLTSSPRSERIAGIVLVLIITGGSYLVTTFLLNLAVWFSVWLYWLLGAWIISTTIAVKGLAKEGRKIKGLLESGQIIEARKQVGYLVSRDTEHLDEKEIIRATVETVAENIVDAVVSPLFYAMLGGPALAMTYRAVNTLDSMCGYKNDKYLYFGWASARLDDLFNFIPARLTGILIVISAWLLRFDAKQAFRIWRRDAHLHPSPNSGIPEATVAGALGIRLGGVNIYFGQPKERAIMGDGTVPLQLKHIHQTILLLYLTSGLFIFSYGLIYFGILLFFY